MSTTVAPARRILLVAQRDDVAVEVTTGLSGGPDVSFLRVATPQRALAILDDPEEHGRFALVIADNDTHPTGGFHLSREARVRRDMGQETPPVLLVLARPQDAWLSDWSQADAYMVRPIDPFDLAEAAEALIEARPLPALPGVGGDPVSGPYDLPGRRRELDSPAQASAALPEDQP
jgi:DNA-binding response OmpR family regulator